MTFSGIVACTLITPSACLAGVEGARGVFRGQTDQNQPMVLRVVRSERLFGFRIGYLEIDCRGRGSDAASPRSAVVRTFGLLSYGRGRRLRTTYSAHRHHRSVEDGLLTYDAHIGIRVSFRAALGRRGAASGTFRVRKRVSGRVIGEIGFDPIRYGCDSGIHRWRVPRMHFSGPWRPTGPMRLPRSFGALVPLRDGRVLLAGGFQTDRPVRPNAEVYEPRRNRWRPAGMMRDGHEFGAAVRLADGRVMVAGGDPRIRRAEIYNPSRNRWSLARPMLTRRDRPSAALLDNGRVLVVGGDSENARFLSAELYDPVAGVWTRVADSPLPAGGADLAGPSIAGRVLVVTSTGTSTTGLSSFYDPASNSWSPPETVPGIDEGPASLTLLADGRVLLVGDCLRNGMRAAAIYGVAGWSAGPPGAPCGDSTATALLPSGRVLLTGYRRAALYDPSENRWTAAPRYFFDAFDEEYVAPLAGGALVVGSDLALNRFSVAERFFER